MSATGIAPGLCSVTFRDLAPESVVELCCSNGISGIEWGGDVHVPVGDEALAVEVRSMCDDAGIAIPSYGSYVGYGPTDAEGYADLLGRSLEVTALLGAPMIRVWAELGVEPDADEPDRSRVIDRLGMAVEAARSLGITVAVEFHPYTLTDTGAATRQLLDEVRADDLRVHWQPDPRIGTDENLAALDLVADRLAHLHVFSWGPDGFVDRHPLADGAALWEPAVARAAAAPTAGGHARFALLEFVLDDSPEQLAADAATLSRWLDAPA